MGVRANVYVHHGDEPGVYLYAHSDGIGLPQKVRVALRRGEDRWGDASYLARIIFSEMVRDNIDGTTGYGISVEVESGGDRIVDVDTATRQVRFRELRAGSTTTASFATYAEIGDERLAQWPSETAGASR